LPTLWLCSRSFDSVSHPILCTLLGMYAPASSQRRQGASMFTW
jgi:hypothetical protein